MPEWFKFTPQMNLVPGQKYWLLHRSESQKYDRMSLMTFLGAGSQQAGEWNARPAAGTQSLPWSWLKAVCEAPAKAAHFVNKDARQWSIPEPKNPPRMCDRHGGPVGSDETCPCTPIVQPTGDEAVPDPDEEALAWAGRAFGAVVARTTSGQFLGVIDKRPVVTADDILPTPASTDLAVRTAETIRDAMIAQSGRRFGVTISPADDADVVAVVCVLEEFAYVVAVAGEADLAELAQDFPAIKYLVHTHTPKPGSVTVGPDGEYADCLGCTEPIHRPGKDEPWYTPDEYHRRQS